MKNNLSIIIVVILAFCAGIIYWWGNYAHKSNGGIPNNLIDVQQFANIDKISISSANKTFTMIKGDNFWKISTEKDAPADAKQISQIIDSISLIKLERVVGKSEAAMKEFGIDKGSRVQFFAKDKSILNINLGDMRTGGGQYLKFNEDNIVYLANSSIVLNSDVESWKYKGTPIPVEKKANTDKKEAPKP